MNKRLTILLLIIPSVILPLWSRGKAAEGNSSLVFNNGYHEVVQSVDDPKEADLSADSQARDRMLEMFNGDSVKENIAVDEKSNGEPENIDEAVLPVEVKSNPFQWLQKFKGKKAEEKVSKTKDEVVFYPKEKVTKKKSNPFQWLQSFKFKKEKKNAPIDVYLEASKKEIVKGSNANRSLLNAIARQKTILEEAKRVKGKASYQEGLREYRMFKFNEALRFFRQAEVYLPENEDVKNYIELCSQQLGVSLSNSMKMKFINEGKDVFNKELILNAKVHLAKAENLLEKANYLWRSGKKNDKMDAQENLKNAEIELRKSEDSTVQLRGWDGKAILDKKINKVDKNVKKNLIKYRAYFKKRKATVAREKAKNLSASSARDESEKIESLLLQAKRDYLNKNYSKSLRIAQLILETDPKNDGAITILNKSRTKKNRKTFESIQMKSREEWKKNLERIEDASIFYSDPVIFPKNWHEINRRKSIQNKKAFEPEWLKVLHQKMKTRVTLHLPDNSLPEITEMLQEQTGVNIRIDSKLELDDARITSLDLRDIHFDSALTLVLKNLSSEEPLEYSMRNGAVFISSKGGGTGVSRLESINYDVTDLITSFSDQGATEGALGNGVTNITKSEEDDTVTTDQLIDLLKRSIDPNSWEVEGVSAEAYESGIILISQTALIHDEIAKLLTKFRKTQKLQVSIEVRFISSTENDLFDIGVDISGLNEVPLEDSGVNVGSGVYSSRDALGSDTRIATVLGSAADSAAAGGQDFIKLNRASEGLFTEISVLDPIRAALVFHALSRKESVKDLIAPRLTVLNNKTGFFRRQVSTHYVANVSPSAGGGVTPEPGIISSGIQLEVRPTVSSDRKYITLTLTPIVTRLISLQKKKITFISTSNGTTASLSTAVITEATLEVPEIENWQLQTTAQVPDGGVLFVGGRMGRQESKVTRGVPILSKIPLLGKLFKTEGDYSKFENLIISVRAKVLIFEELENKIH